MGMKCEDCDDQVSSNCYCQIVNEQTLKSLAEMGQAYDADDNVNNPSHYNQAGIECIDAIKASLGDNYQDYCKGNIMKYLWRYKYKNGIEDLKKAQWYLNSMIDSVEGQ